MKTPGRTTSLSSCGSSRTSTVNRRPNLFTLLKKSTRNKYTTGVRNTYQSGSWNADGELSDYGKRSIKLPPNERDTTKRTHITDLVDAVKAIVRSQDKMRMTRKENIEGNPNLKGYMNANMPPFKQTVYDPDDIAKTTKETLIHDHVMGILPQICHLVNKQYMILTILHEQLPKKRPGILTKWKHKLKSKSN